MEKNNANSDSSEVLTQTKNINQDSLIKVESIIEDLNKRISGKWFLKKEDHFVLTRTNKFHSKCFWEFGPNNSFKSSCNDVIDFSSSKKFDWTINEKIYLNTIIKG